ncbi:thioredoxin-like protein AAED1, chloroplastic [Herrania umbratica]|uniref:Thioredoxin-like protein AAED1, chloroplastic n=1 Tax=Herrania umbratica TaxID=108875 RepID=A0A6J0ZH93_9ROSI|nr:thioredoxin-like protein AAED1, chloroplastic [Herrania umbratica]
MATVSSQILLCCSTPKSKFPTINSSPSCFLTPTKVTYKPTKLMTFNSKGNSRFITRAASSLANEFTANIGDVLGDVSVFTAAGQRVFFKDLWDQKEGIAVVALLRHFGCFCSWELASTLREAMPKFDSAGVKLIAVGVGTPDKARILAERLPFPMDYLYADPDRKAYDVLGLYYGLGRTFFNPASAKLLSRLDKLQKAMENYTMQATPDNKSSVLQQGGMFVFKGKELLYARKDEGTGDHAPLDDIFDVCCNGQSHEVLL